MSGAYEGRQIVGMDLHRRRSVLVRMTETGQHLETVRISNDPDYLRQVMTRAGEAPDVVLEATYGWYWAADTLAELGARVHLAHPLGVKMFAMRRVKNDQRDAADLADLLRMGRLPEAWIAPPATRELRGWVRHRAKLVALRSNLKCQVHAVLAAAGIAVPMSDLFGATGRQLLAATRLSVESRSRVDSLNRLITALDFEIDLSTQLVAGRLRTDPGYQTIQQIPGVGAVLGAVFVAEIGDITRFDRPQQLAPWAGLTPCLMSPTPPCIVAGSPRWDVAAAAAASVFDRPECGEVVVAIVGGIDIHRAQLTFDYVDLDSGEVFRGRIAPADRAQLRQWLDRFLGRTDVAFALEGCTGWRYVVEELHRAGITAHVAEPAETAARRGPKRRAKTDRSDAQLLRDLLLEGRIPESWIPPQPVWEARALVRLYKDLLDERTGWLQRVHASMFQMGVPDLDVSTMSAAGRDRITAAELSAATRTAVDVAMRQVDRLTAEMTMVREQIHAIGRRQPACRALQAAHYGIGPLTSVVIWAEMGDTRRFRSSDDAVRHAGLDVTVYSSDGRRSAGHLARQGPPMLRWALYEAAVYAGRPSSPDHAYFQQVKARLDGQLALLSMARKLARRCHHTLRNLDDQVLAPAA